MKKKRATQYAVILVILAVLFAGGWWWLSKRTSNASTAGNTTVKNNSSAAAQTSTGQSSGTPASGFNKSAHSLIDPASIWVVVNKTRQLNPKDYAPSNLVVPDIPLRSNITSTEKYVSATMAGPLKTMVDAAKAEGVQLNLQSGYRSYSFQVSLYNGYVQQQGQAAADSQSARPGYSEHQTGLAADLGGITQPSCNVADCFANTTEGKWLAANAYKYGFIIRYPADKVSITGYIYEPWHVRYIGTDLSTELHNKNIETLEEFFGLPAAPDYK